MAMISKNNASHFGIFKETMAMTSNNHFGIFVLNLSIGLDYIP